MFARLVIRFAGVRLWICGLGLAVAATLSVGLSYPGSAEAVSCSQVSPVSSNMTLSPQGVELPEGAAASFQASVGPVDGVIGAPGLRVSYRVTCGPDEGQSGVAYTSAHFAYEPRRYQAVFAIHNHGVVGTDDIAATSSLHGKRVTATISVEWVSRRPTCDRTIRFLAAFKCALKLADNASETVKCVVGVGSFLIPADKFGVLLRAAGTLKAAETTGRELGASLAVVKLAVDLRSLAAREGISVGRLVAALGDARDASSFIKSVWALVHDAADPEISQIAFAIANLTGLTPCVELLSNVLGPASTLRAVSLATLCRNGNVSIDAVNGCPFPGHTTVGASTFAYDILIENNDDSVTPEFWDLIDFPRTTCRSITLTFGMPTSRSSPGDQATIAVASSSGTSQTATAGYGQIGTLIASLSGSGWSLENSATNSDDQIAINGTAQCDTASGYGS